MNEWTNEGMKLLFLYGFFNQLKTYLHERCMQIHTVCTKEKAPKKLRPQISTYLLRIRIKRGNKGKNKD